MKCQSCLKELDRIEEDRGLCHKCNMERELVIARLEKLPDNFRMSIG